MLGNHKLPSFCWEFLHACWNMPLSLSQVVTTVPFISLYPCTVSRSPRSEILDSFHVFPKYVYSLGHAFSLIHVCGLLHSQKFVIAFQSYMWISFSPDFPLLVCYLPHGDSLSQTTIKLKKNVFYCLKQTPLKKELFTLCKMWFRSIQTNLK